MLHPKISLIYNALIECMMNGIVRFSRSCKCKVKHTIKIFFSTRASSNFMEKNLHKHYARLFQCWLVFVFASQSKQIFCLTARCNLDFMHGECTFAPKLWLIKMNLYLMPGFSNCIARALISNLNEKQLNLSRKKCFERWRQLPVILIKEIVHYWRVLFR